MIELETKNEILEVVLRNMVSESMNMSIPNWRYDGGLHM
jgi:hypothetical protein